MYTLPDLPYKPEALEPYLDAETMLLHHGKHHATYVNSLNEALVGHEELATQPVDALIADLSKVPEAIRTKVRNFGGGHANHSLFWTVMAPATGSDGPEGKLRIAIEQAFGNFDEFRERFGKAAMGRFGSGWAWLVVEGGALSIMDTANQDSPLSQGKHPILTLDVWEHAYYLKYRNRRAEYVSAWWNVVDWRRVAELYEQAR